MADHARGLASVILDMVEGRPVTIGQAAVRMGASRRTATRLLRALDEEIGARGRCRWQASQGWAALTPSEQLIVSALARSRGRFVHADELAGVLGYEGSECARRTVRVHVSNARGKGVRIVTETGRGYALEVAS
jgi:DNA-binding response OmpR family regulator